MESINVNVFKQIKQSKNNKKNSNETKNNMNHLTKEYEQKLKIQSKIAKQPILIANHYRKMD